MKVNIYRGKPIKNEYIEKTKVRAIIKTDDDKFLVANYGGVLMFPGGKLEDSEYLVPAILRELKEEIGIEYDVTELEPLTAFKQIQPNYHTREGKIVDRTINTFYYVAPYKGVNTEAAKLSEKEKRDKFKLELLTEEEIYSFIENNKTNNPRKKYFIEELKIVMQTYKNHKKGNSKTLFLDLKHLDH